MEALKFCLVCGQRLRGRTDKRFCDDKCRSCHHYQRTIEKRALNSNLVRTTNQILIRNRTILEGLYLEGKSRTTKLALHRLGFIFTHYTRVENTGNYQYRFFCYDIGYQIRNEEVRIIY